MRIRKFRAWDKEKKIMCDVFYIHFDLRYVGIKAPNYCVFEREIEKVVLMNLIGQKDRNKKEIYEGDIISYDIDNKGTTRRAEVVFNEDGFYLEWEDGWVNQTGDFKLEDCEIIGNIYDNPDLLKGH